MGSFLRNLGAAALGFVVMAGLAIVLFLLGGIPAALLGSGWGLVALTIVVSLLAAVIGGIVCAKVQADARGMWILIAVVVVAGVVTALNPGDDAEAPMWLAWLNPLLGAVGVYFGARRVKGD